MKPAEGSTVIGKSVTVKGEISAKEDMYMDGIVEGTISLPDSRLTVGPNGRVVADLQAHDVVIYGKVDGNIRAAGRLELRPSNIRGRGRFTDEREPQSPAGSAERCPVARAHSD